MASGEAEPLQYTTTVLRVSIHCEGCKKKVKKVLHSIEGVYKVTIDAAQHKVIVTGSVGADALVRRLQKAGKQAALWPVPAPAAEVAKKPEEVAAAPSAAGDGDKDANDKAEAKPKEVAKDKGSVKKPEKEKGSDKKQEKGAEKKPEKEKGADKKQEKAEVSKPKDGEAPEPKEKGSPEPPAKEAAAEEASGEEGSAKKGKKKKNKQKDGGDGGEAAAAEKPPPQPAMPAPAPPQLLGPAERPHGGFPYYAAQPVMSYNVTHPSASVSYYAPTPAMPMPPPPPAAAHHVPYGYPPMMPMPEYMYGPPGMRSSPPHGSYNMFNEENANSCSLM